MITTDKLEGLEITPNYPTLDELLTTSPKLKREDVDHLQDWMSKQPHLPTVPDEHLVSFIHTCQYSLERAKIRIDRHFTIRTHVPELFADRDTHDPELQRQLKLFQMAALGRMVPSGYIVGGCNVVPNVAASEYNFNIDMKICAILKDCLVRQYPTCPGYILILNAKGLTMAHLGITVISTLRHIFAYTQAGMNLRLKAVHVINVTPVVDTLMTFIKPLLRKTSANTLHFHSGEMEEFYQQFPRDILPEDYGGTLKTMADYHNEVLERLKFNKEWLLKQEKMVVDEARRPEKATSNGDLLGVQGSFKKLEID